MTKTDPAADQTDEKPTDATETPDAPETPEQPSEADDGQAEGQEDTTGDDEPVRKLRREAQQLRQRAKDAEAARDEAADALAAAEQSVVNYALELVNLDARLWELSQVDLDQLRTEAGTLDVAAVVAHAQQVRREVFGGPQPNPQQGTPSQRRAASTLAEAFTPNRR